jgi:hypothetical protein
MSGNGARGGGGGVHGSVNGRAEAGGSTDSVTGRVGSANRPWESGVSRRG